MALVLNCNVLKHAHVVASFVCLASLPGADSEELSAEGVEATTGAGSTCEALVQGLLIGVLGITAAAVKDHGASALRSLRARRRAAQREAAEGTPAGAAARANSEDRPQGAAAAANPQEKGGRSRPAVAPWARTSDARDSPAAAVGADGFGEMLAAARGQPPEAAEAAASPAAQQRPERPALPKPGRGARVVQMRSKVAEFCSLSFDEVDTTEQMGLTCRMLATLKSFAEDVVYWEGTSKVDEPAFSLLGLDEVAQFALLRTAERAAALVEERCWREAYRELCTARPWLPSESPDGPAEAQRAEVVAELGRAKAQAKQDFHGPSQKEPRGGSPRGSSRDSDTVAIVMRLPAGCTGHVLGPRAATVTALQAETGARVWLDVRKDEAHVSGPPHAVEAARRGIRFLLTPLRGAAAAPPVRAPPPERGRSPAKPRGRSPGSTDDEETRAGSDEEPPGSPCSTSSGDASGRSVPRAGRWSEHASSDGLKLARGSAGAVSLSGIWQECASVAYRVQARGESWTAHPCGGHGGSEKAPIEYDDAAGVYWMGATRAFVAVRVDPERLDWYPAEDKKRSKPAFSWTRKPLQRRRTA
ncbi:unnamed protein product [Prorocentrum cordatum]|uniref:K Homology domain-containing protein n=1 Tax=Prorocentrum cordatum TaxID=2364126 RepID=A0ABN9PZI8_9DINO|nr:unnamed protein product [Polarella glacialis]